MVILREQKRHTKGMNAKKLWKDTDTCLKEEKEEAVGFAVDIGTTTIALTAVALKQREIIGELSETNEQTRLGADVMMRIMHSLSGKQEKLHRMVVDQIEQMAKRVLMEHGLIAGFKSSQVYFSIVGNTTMCHLFLNRSVEGLAGYPFKADYRGNYQCTGKEIGMEFFEDAHISVLSGIAAHVGSDALAVIGAEKLFRKDMVQLAVDLGTNAEIILNQRGKLWVCSTAAGPAFEGKGIQCGMSAKAGAVNGMKVSSANGNIILEYIKGETPKGICGSGLVDAIAELRKCKVLQSDGYLLTEEEARGQRIHPELCSRLTKKNGQNAFLFYKDEKSGKEIYLQQGDIRGVQLAKGAIQAGILSLLSESQTKLSEIDEMVVAGVLGSCIRSANAVGIGLLPGIKTERLHFAGNAAGRGAVCALIDAQFLMRMEQLAKEIYHIELAETGDFQSLLMQAMNLQSWM